MRAIISVANRERLDELGRALAERQVTIFATGGTAAALQSAGVAVQPVSGLIQFPEILGGRVKTLHPHIYGGILARRSDPAHMRELEEHGIVPIDLVAVNLYPFIETVAREGVSLEEAQEQIDIGGVALIRAAAKNFQDVVVLVRPQDYELVLQEWQERGEVSQETRRRLAAIAFQYTASYDTAIAEYLRSQDTDYFPEELTLPLQRIQALRYGENPHQRAAFYRWGGLSTVKESRPAVATAEVLHGKELSFNNLLDLDAALAAAGSFAAPTVAIIKHTNPCGLACGDTLLEAYRKAHAGDPVSAYGGIIGCNRPVEVDVAQEIHQLFYEAVIAPEFTPEALAILRQKKNIRLLATHAPIDPSTLNAQIFKSGRFDIRSVSGGVLLQTADFIGEHELEYRVVTERKPTLEEMTDLMFAWKVVRHVKSNAIVLAHKLAVVGVGAGQMNRVTSVQLAVEKAGERARGAVLASDAFFPFADGVEAAAKAGVTAIIQPGGSIRDEDSIRVANQHAIAMIFTGKRHFRH
ncbi:bifunctional phosphoribosylaminoimidazolecarboxamide formyltransferase/IMP cyclohydrolase [Thermogemmatispora onikobensis]|uniref:bifunctional phosphoribosylaminoimidazolecarboxamide formyltransferase/IMP cyclohydrolase n=1 Tax=Thermogemmatispora onikobensis TaxID=732234 RepID=UPI0008529AFE|nr:bifunctional phosphoribosylaminoimidazolecarboxamide formyltransferase/IMP cyclohydrolase [Thermogemmatispora onikobensis]